MGNYNPVKTVEEQDALDALPRLACGSIAYPGLDVVRQYGTDVVVCRIVSVGLYHVRVSRDDRPPGQDIEVGHPDGYRAYAPYGRDIPL